MEVRLHRVGVDLPRGWRCPRGGFGLKELSNGGPRKRPYQKPELRKLTPAEAQARLREHALRTGSAAVQWLHRPSQHGLVR